ncbi:MAG TPA: carbon-nitrogen hydrolase family protein [Planctomycetota bacterium]|nr:carbon-nitrogen hydrolase family protein [Planctomycetota bacterium]
MKSFIAAAASTAARWGAIDENLEQVTAAAESAADCGARLLLLPECCLTGANWPTGVKAPAVEAVALALHSSPLKAVQRIARRTGLVIAVGFYERRTGPAGRGGGGIRITQALVSGKGIQGVYRKVHEGAHSSHEKDLFPVFDLGFARVGISVCFDNMFPECARILALKGAEVLLSPFTSLPLTREAWRAERLVALRARAFDNRLFVLSASHAQPHVAGRPPEWGYSGICCAVSPLGDVLAESTGKPGRPQGIAVALDEMLTRTYMLAHVPSMRARRPGAYRDLDNVKLQAKYLKHAAAYVYPERADRTVVTPPDWAEPPKSKRARRKQ